jgi:hypothetical protein
MSRSKKRLGKSRRSYVKPSASGRAALNIEGLEGRDLLSVTLAGGFYGFGFDLSQGGATPPDTQVAAGPSAVMEAVNTNVAIIPKSGATPFTDTFDTLFSGVRVDALDNTLLTDVSVHFDADAPGVGSLPKGRFILSCLDLDMTTGQSYLDFGISANSEPAQAGDFLVAQINVTEKAAQASPNAGSTLFTDFDRYGSSANAYVFTFNMFTNPISTASLFDHVQVLAINKSDLLSSAPSLVPHFVDLSGWNGSNIVNENLAPVDMHGAQATDPTYFVEETSYGSATNSQLRLLKVANILTATAGDFQSFDVTVPTYTTNPVPDAAHPWNSGDMNANASQLGSSDQMQTNDTRILSAAWRRDAQGVEHLVASQIVGASLARARWYEFITSTSSPTLNQSGEVGASGAASYFPSIDIAPNGNIGMDFLESSSSEYMSMYVTGRTMSDPLGTMQTPTLAQAGQASYTLLGLEASPHRAGDFSGIGVDIDSSGNPLNTFWAANEYTDPNGLWATVLMNFSVTPSNPLSPITVSAAALPNPVVAGTTTALSATATDPNAGATITKYTWSVQSGPSGVTFDSNNGTSAGNNVTATFSQAGTYSFLVTANDSLGATGSNTVTVTVQQALTSITVSPATATVMDGGSTPFTGSGLDQFGKAMTTQPSFTWTVNSPAAGSITSSGGVYTAPATGHGTDTVRATSGSVSRTATVTYAQPPTITSISANLNPGGKSAQLTATANDPNGVGGLIYTWSLVSGPAAVTFGSNNGTTSGNNVTASFAKAGSYTFQVTVTDSYGVTSSQTVTVNVAQTLTSVKVSPATTTIRVNGTVQFNATAFDQFGNSLAIQPSFSWALVSGPGTVSNNGLYTGTNGGTAVIRATAAGVSGTATVTVRRH